ncbi:hypothetical protein [Pararobbsia silviterrae]|uniref:Glycine zipper domain-containing protein n=1 Tax=Pararobbsia silviterrae TaxID=1792498 RepID=A0A494Y5P5_9BURK|nr:hypothetical protein [Pararobbsia silviterrae]RKP55891.1 hypothetical protein D7S86_11865 [Pararobbsia silviterrae]
MSLIVAGRFQTFERAEQAAHHLVDDDGFPRDDVQVFYVNPPGQHDMHASGDIDADGAMQPERSSTSVGLAAGALVGFGVGIGAMQILELNWLAPAIMTAVGAYLGSLIGAMTHTTTHATTGHDDRAQRVAVERIPEPVRESGVMLAVHVSDDSERRAEESLRHAGARDVELASGIWSEGRWRDFNPVAAPATAH